VSHPPLSVVVTASGSPDDFAACLESLRPSLGPRDEVVCVVPADRADLRRELIGNAWLTVLDDRSGDQAARWSAGVAATTHEIVVLLDGDVIGSARWLDPLGQAFAAPDVVAAGPRCHRSYGPQGVELPREAMTDTASFKAYAREWRQRHRNEVLTVDRLGPVCVAVRRAALERAGGTLSYEELRAQGRVVLVNGALVAHVGADRCTLRHATGERPLVSASMIVKDEEDVLAASLTALGEFADEIVVYDTGSTDRTVEIARQHGARVVEGYWNDHFADARNRSIAHCRGEWIFVVDADEIASGDAAALRAQLAAATEAARIIHVQSLEGHGHEGRGVLSVRFFRRYGRYDGRLHEQVVDGITGDSLTGPVLPGVELVHSGYTSLRYATKDKGTRNVRLAELAVDDHDGSPGALVNLARSHAFAGDTDAAIDVCQRALATDSGRYRQTFLQVLVHASISAGRFETANGALAELRQEAGNALLADDLEARLRFTEGDYAAVLAILAAFPESGTDQRFTILSRRQLVDVEIMSLFNLGRHRAAAQLLSDCLAQGELPLSVAQMATVLGGDGGNVATIGALVPRGSLRGVLLSASEAPLSLVDELLEGLWAQHPGEAGILALAARAGSYLPLIRSLEWAARLRQHGFAESCTLLALAGAGTRTPRERSLAAAVALEMYGDERAMPLLSQALEAVTDDEAPRLLDEMRLLAPGIAAAVEPAGV
jgi:GT2 family glycosyltransferase